MEKQATMTKESRAETTIKRDLGMEMMSCCVCLVCTTLSVEALPCRLLSEEDLCELQVWFTVMSTSMLVGKLLGK